jgi:hypothetical protein
MNMEQMQQFKRMRKDIEELKAEIKLLKARKKPGPKPKSTIDVIRQRNS